MVGGEEGSGGANLPLEVGGREGAEFRCGFSLCDGGLLCLTCFAEPEWRARWPCVGSGMMG